MSERRERILGIMNRQTRAQAGKLSARLAELRDREYQEFDLADRVRQMREHARLGKETTGHEGDLKWAVFVGVTLTKQLSASTQRSAKMRGERAALEAELSKLMMREKSIRENLEEVVRTNRDGRALLEDSKDPPWASRSTAHR